MCCSGLLEQRNYTMCFREKRVHTAKQCASIAPRQPSLRDELHSVNAANLITSLFGVYSPYGDGLACRLRVTYRLDRYHYICDKPNKKNPNATEPLLSLPRCPSGHQWPHRGAAQEPLLHRRRPVQRPGGVQLGRRQQRAREQEEAEGAGHRRAHL